MAVESRNNKELARPPRRSGMFYPETGPVRSALEKIQSILPISPFVRNKDLGVKQVFLCMTPRSGSTYLGSALAANGIGKFAEHFRIVGGSLEKAVESTGVRDYEEYVRHIVERYSRNGLFGTKLGWNQFAPLYYTAAVPHYFENARYIYLTREDILAQTISRFVSTETGYFHSTNKELESTKDNVIEFNFDKFVKHMDFIIDMQSAWEMFFARESILPLRITYEQIEHDPTEVIKKIAAFIDVKLPTDIIVDTEYKKVRNERHDDIRSRAIAEFQERRNALLPAFM